VQLLLQWKSNKYYTFSVYVCIFIYPACEAHEPYYVIIRGLPRTTISHKW